MYVRIQYTFMLDLIYLYIHNMVHVLSVSVLIVVSPPIELRKIMTWDPCREARASCSHSKLWPKRMLQSGNGAGYHMGVSENSVSLNPMIDDHYPY